MAVTISGSGQVPVQVKQTILTTAVTTTSTTFTDVTGLSVNITPVSASNKVLVSVSMFLGTGNATGMLWRITRNGTAIARNIDQTNKGTGGYYSGTNAGDTWDGTSVNFIDSPATTSSVTYQVQFVSGNGTAVGINRRMVATDFGGVSTITVMEISG